MKRAAYIAALLAILPTAFAATRAQYLMGTVCEISADVDSSAAFAEARRVEQMLSTWRDDSELARVNRGAQPGDELRALLAIAERYAADTGHAFDPHVMPLLLKYGIRKGQQVDGPNYEEGAFGKGYAIDRMLDVLRREGAKDAVINFGGQVGAIGAHEVSIADPEHRDRPILDLTISGSISTSSTSEKGLHIVDPRSGRLVPAWGSVSVISDSALEADILSTALYVMGREAGVAWARQHHVKAIFIDKSTIERTD
jgi:thiamine biosynthesis lipoprotein